MKRSFKIKCLVLLTCIKPMNADIVGLRKYFSFFQLQTRGFIGSYNFTINFWILRWRNDFTSICYRKRHRWLKVYLRSSLKFIGILTIRGVCEYYRSSVDSVVSKHWKRTSFTSEFTVNNQKVICCAGYVYKIILITKWNWIFQYTILFHKRTHLWEM